MHADPDGLTKAPINPLLKLALEIGPLMVFFFASYALSQPDSWVGFAADVFPLSSPFAMLALAAQSERLAPHALALAWQALWVYLFVRAGAALFRRRVMKSGPARAGRAPGTFSDLLRKTRRAAG